MHKPAWFRDGEVIVSTATTSGINKDGHDLFVVDPETGKRTEVIDDQLAIDVESIVNLKNTNSTQTVSTQTVNGSRIAVPSYYDNKNHDEFVNEMDTRFPGFTIKTIGNLIDEGLISVRKGHGSPSQDLRTGEVPYIKVSDLRAGSVNINPTNLVPGVIAKRFWRGEESGLQAFDLLSPERASKNIGDFCVLMPGQEQVVLTKEILVFRATPKASFDQFYLIWALSLNSVRKQWDRIIFMQTNREDVGNRYLEIEIPVPPNVTESQSVSSEFRRYFMGISELRSDFAGYLSKDKMHHFHLES